MATFYLKFIPNAVKHQSKTLYLMSEAYLELYTLIHQLLPKINLDLALTMFNRHLHKTKPLLQYQQLYQYQGHYIHQFGQFL